MMLDSPNAERYLVLLEDINSNLDKIFEVQKQYRTGLTPEIIARFESQSRKCKSIIHDLARELRERRKLKAH